MSTFIAICIIGFFIMLFSGRGAGKKRPNIKEPAKIISPIQAATEADFDTSAFFVEPEELPLTEDSWLTISKDKNRLIGYGTKLDTIQLTSKNAANRAVTKYRTDLEQLNDQQLQIYRRLYGSRRLTARFRELKKHRISARDLPQGLQLILPSAPTGLSSIELTKKYTFEPKIGSAISRALTANGGVIKNPDNLYAAAVVAIIGAGIYLIKGKSNNSKLKRTLEDGRGTVINYNKSMITEVEAIKKYHADIVNVSSRLKDAEIQLIDMITKVERISPKLKKLDQVGAESRKDLQSLYFLTMEAIAYSKANI